jgi:hypothetical protein
MAPRNHFVGWELILPGICDRLLDTGFLLCAGAHSSSLLNEHWKNQTKLALQAPLLDSFFEIVILFLNE